MISKGSICCLRNEHGFLLSQMVPLQFYFIYLSFRYIHTVIIDSSQVFVVEV